MLNENFSPIPVAGSFTLAFALTKLRAEAAATAEPARSAEARDSIWECCLFFDLLAFENLAKRVGRRFPPAALPLAWSY
jgi:hypothetical protein